MKKSHALKSTSSTSLTDPGYKTSPSSGTTPGSPSKSKTSKRHFTLHSAHFVQGELTPPCITYAASETAAPVGRLALTKDTIVAHSQSKLGGNKFALVVKRKGTKPRKVSG